MLFEYSFESIMAGVTNKSVDLAVKNTTTLKDATAAVSVPPPIIRLITRERRDLVRGTWLWDLNLHN